MPYHHSTALSLESLAAHHFSSFLLALEAQPVPNQKNQTSLPLMVNIYFCILSPIKGTSRREARKYSLCFRHPCAQLQPEEVGESRYQASSQCVTQSISRMFSLF